MTRTLATSLEERGHTWSLVDRRFSTSIEDVGKFAISKVVAGLWLQFRIIAARLRFRPDAVIFFATNRTFSFLVDWAVSEVLRIAGIRTILYLHTTGFEALAHRGPVWAWLARRLLRSGDTVVTLGTTLAADIMWAVDERRIKFVSNAVSDCPDTDAESEPVTRDSVLYFSNLIPEKGADTFVETALGLIDEHPDMTFVLAGATADQEFSDSLVSKVAAASVSDRFVFNGPVTDARRKYEILQRAAVLAFPSTYPFEAQPLTILEALSVGTPVVAFDVGGVRDIIRDGVDGYLVPAGDHPAFRRALLRVLAGELHDGKAHRSIPAHDEERFSPTVYAQRWDQLLRRVG